MKQAKCPNCGANIIVDETKDAGICEYCNSAFVTEKAVSNVYNSNNVTNNNQVINNYYNNASMDPGYAKVPRRPRPRVKIWLALLLLFFYIVPGILYIIYIKYKQKKWDDKYTY